MSRLGWIISFWFLATLLLGIAVETATLPTTMALVRTLVNVGFLGTLIAALVSAIVLSVFMSVARHFDRRRPDWVWLRDCALTVGVLVAPVNWTLKLYGLHKYFLSLLTVDSMALGIILVILGAKGETSTELARLRFNKWLIVLWLVGLTVFAAVPSPYQSWGPIFWIVLVLNIGTVFVFMVAAATALVFRGIMRLARSSETSPTTVRPNLVNGGLLVGIWGGLIHTSLNRVYVPAIVLWISTLLVAALGYIWASRNGDRASVDPSPPNT